MDGSITIRPFDAFIYRLAEDISKGLTHTIKKNLKLFAKYAYLFTTYVYTENFSRMLALSGSFESSHITATDREKIKDQYQLFRKMEHYDLINDTKCAVLVDLLKQVNMNDLALEVEVRYIIGFDKDISRKELRRKVKAHQQKVLACAQKDMKGAEVAKTATSARIPESTREVAELLKSRETAVTDGTKIAGLLQSTESEVIEGVTSNEEKKYYIDANKVESWMIEKMALVCIDEYGKNTQGAKALLVKHVRLEEEIAAYEYNINKLGEQAQFIMSMDSKNPASQMEREAELVDVPYEVEETHVEEKVQEREFVEGQKLLQAEINNGATHLDKESVEMRQQAINKAYERLCKLAKARHGYLEDVIQVYSFYKECDDFEDWMIEKERALQRQESHLHKMETVTRKFSDLLTDLMMNASRFDKISEMADEFKEANHSQQHAVMERQKKLQEKWEEVNQLREAKLSYSMKLYSQAWDEIKGFILKKTPGLGNNDDIMQIKQQNVIEALVMEHQNLEKELALEKEKMATLEMLAKAIRISYPRDTDIVASKQREIKELWESLLDKVLDRKPKLNAAHSICQFHVDAKDPKFPKLLSATIDKDLSKIEMLIGRGEDINVTSQDGYTCLHIAAGVGDMNVVEYLTRAGVNIEKENEEKMTALTLAARNGHQDIVKFLLKSGANVNTSDGQKLTPLHWAVLNSHVEVVKILVKAGAHLEARNRVTATPIHLASLCGNVDIVKVFIEAGVDKELPGEFNCTPLICAAQYDKYEVVEYLIDVAGVNIEAVSTTKYTALHYAAQKGYTKLVQILVSAGANMEAREKKNAAPIHLACFGGHLDTVKIFIQAKADIDLRGHGGWTPLIFAIQGGSVELVKYLISNGADLNAVDVHGSIPLHWASQGGHTKIAKILLDAGSNMEARDKWNTPPVHRACYHKHLNMVKFFVDAGMDKEIQGPHNNTPLASAAHEGDGPIVKYLISVGANKEALNTDNMTPLMYAAEQGHAHIVRILLKAKANIDAYDKERFTALIWAADKGNYMVVKALIDAGADREICDTGGKTAFRHALDKGHTRIAKLLTA